MRTGEGGNKFVLSGIHGTYGRASNEDRTVKPGFTERVFMSLRGGGGRLQVPSGDSDYRTVTLHVRFAIQLVDRMRAEMEKLGIGHLPEFLRFVMIQFLEQKEKERGGKPAGQPDSGVGGEGGATG